MIKHAETDHPIHELMAQRWSPYCFSKKLISNEDLHSLFEAARWAASSYNEQPWSYIVATREQNDELQARDANRRPRKSIREFVFGGKWGSRSDLV